MDIYLVKWIDSSARHGWQDPDENKKWTLKDLECTTIGFKIQEDKDVLVLIMGFQPEQWDTLLCIPKSAIKKITKLKTKVTTIK